MTRIYLFEKHFKEIYPEKLQSKKENVSYTKASFFDINLEIKDNHISTKSYDKWDSFPFEVPFMLSLTALYPLKFFIFPLVLKYSFLLETLVIISHS